MYIMRDEKEERSKQYRSCFLGKVTAFCVAFLPCCLFDLPSFSHLSLKHVHVHTCTYMLMKDLCTVCMHIYMYSTCMYMCNKYFHVIISTGSDKTEPATQTFLMTSFPC